MNTLPGAAGLEEGVLRGSLCDIFTRGPPARTNGKGFIFLKSEVTEALLLLFEESSETCVSAESFLHLPVRSAPPPAVCRGFWKHGHIKVSAQSFGTQPLPAPPIPARQKTAWSNGVGLEALCFHRREGGGRGCCVCWIFQPLVTPQMSVTS